MRGRRLRGCAVLLGGLTVNSCLVYAMECGGGEIETVEGVAMTAEGRAVIDAFDAFGAVQCGVCIPGFAWLGSPVSGRLADR